MDDRLAAIMSRIRREFGRHCQQDADNTWRVEVLTSGGRSQVVSLYVRNNAPSKHDWLRLVAFSPIGLVSSHVNFEKVLRRNADLDVGAIAIEDISSQDNIRLPFLIFRATHLIETADYPEVWELIIKTAEYADELEQTLFAKDTF